jgi:formylglycine-generating enzyme required for sulfatase activity
MKFRRPWLVVSLLATTTAVAALLVVLLTGWPRKGNEIRVNLGDGIVIEMVRIEPGQFNMGSPDKEKGRECDEKLHPVRITRPFYMGKYEVTQAQWKAIMGENPSTFENPRGPVDGVSWDGCQDFIQKLNKKAHGFTFRLPTEAEWEYACRAGTATAYSFGDGPGDLSNYAWIIDNSDGRTHRVGSRKPNPWGLYDMHGNVEEWCSDWYEEYGEKAEGEVEVDPVGPGAGTTRVLRGGCWYVHPQSCRSASRYSYTPALRITGLLGLRLVSEPKP